jgi:hAT family C-terminal dimerisation region
MLKWACESLQVVRPGQTTTDRDRVASGTETSAQSVVMDKDSANKSLKRRLVEKILQEKGVSQNSDVDEEILKYLKYAPTDAEAEDGLLFWQTHGINYPTLRKVACYYLCVSASSVPVESMFSITGLILNNKRSSLSPIKLNYLSFIHDNCL